MATFWGCFDKVNCAVIPERNITKAHHTDNLSIY